MSTEYQVADGVSVEDWIDGVSYLQAEVRIHRNPALLSTYQPLMNDILTLEAERQKIIGPQRKTSTPDEALGEDAPAAPPAAELSLNESNPLVQEIDTQLAYRYTEAEALWKQYSEDVEIWTIRRIDEAEAADLLAELGGMPDAPAKPPVNAKPQAKTAYGKKFEAWYEQVQTLKYDLNLRCLERAVLSVKVKGKEVRKPTLEGLMRLEKRPGGKKHLEELVAAMESLVAEGPAVTAPHRQGS